MFPYLGKWRFPSTDNTVAHSTGLLVNVIVVVDGDVKLDVGGDVGWTAVMSSDLPNLFFWMAVIAVIAG